MKKILVLMTSMLLWLGMFSACSSDDDVTNGSDSLSGWLQESSSEDNVTNKSDSLPEWLQEKISLYEDGNLPVEVYQCLWTGKRIFHFYCGFSSDNVNCYYYEDGTNVSSSDVGSSEFWDINSWQLLYYNEKYPLSNEHNYH
jgi:hypothetical protein